MKPEVKYSVNYSARTDSYYLINNYDKGRIAEIYDLDDAVKIVMVLNKAESNE